MSKLQFPALALLCCLCTFPAFSQISIGEKSAIQQLKKTTTYIVMPDTGSAVAQTYKAIFQQYWTVTPTAFIEYKDILEHLSPEASFFSIGGYTTTSTFVHMTERGGRREGLSYSNTHLYLELWMCDPELLQKWQNRKKKKEELPDKVKRIVARIELYTDFPTLAQPENIYQTDYDGGGHIYNWGPGYLKNYLQCLMQFLEAGSERSLFKAHSLPAQLKNLRRQTLYVPDYVLVKFNKFNGDESKRHEVSDLFGNYKLPYVLLSNAALNEKILADAEPFYYLVYIKSSTDKYLCVYNSRTGELVYTTYTPVSYNLKDKDLEKLAEAIKGK